MTYLQPVQQNINNLHKVHMNIIFVYKSYFSYVTLSHIHHIFMISSNPKLKYISMKDYYVEACRVPINQNCLVHNRSTQHRSTHTHTHTNEHYVSATSTSNNSHTRAKILCNSRFSNLVVSNTKH